MADHAHSHAHSHDHAHTHDHAHGHSHAPAVKASSLAVAAGPLTTLGLSAGRRLLYTAGPVLVLWALVFWAMRGE